MKFDASPSVSSRSLADAQSTASVSMAALSALMIAHCAGMLDLVALPVWVGTLTSTYRLNPQAAGALVTCFLVGVVLSSCFFSPRLARICIRVAIPTGFAIAAVAFGFSATTNVYSYLCLLHLTAGASIGCSLSLTHGFIGRSNNPHRLFATVGLALGIFAILFLGATPIVIAHQGGGALFVAFSALMTTAAAYTAFAFPSFPDNSSPRKTEGKIPPAAWSGMAGVSLMAINQAMIFSFVIKLGLERGFNVASVTTVLVALGVVNLLPSPLAAFLQRKLSARVVLCVGPIAQSVLALTISQSSAFLPYAIATAMFPAVMIFTHTFAFGTLASIDQSGRVVAATPVMLMAGAAVGPILGGSLAMTLGFGSLGYAALAVGLCALTSFTRLTRATL